MRPFDALKIRTAGALPWTPSYLTSPPVFWWDDSTTVTNVSGAASTWSNKGAGAAAYDLQQTTAGNRPSINATGLNSLRTLTFDGTNDNLVTNDANARAFSNNVGSIWVFAVVRKVNVDGSPTFRGAWQTNTGVQNLRTGLQLGNGTTANRVGLAARRLDADGAATIQGGTALGTGWRLVMVTMDYTNRPGTVYLDGVQDGTNATLTTAGSTSATTSTDQMIVGASISAGTPSSFSDMEIAAMLGGRNNIPTTTERQKMEGWAAWRYGLTANLDVSHPYKSAPPTV